MNNLETIPSLLRQKYCGLNQSLETLLVRLQTYLYSNDFEGLDPDNYDQTVFRSQYYLSYPQLALTIKVMVYVDGIMLVEILRHGDLIFSESSDLMLNSENIDGYLNDRLNERVKTVLSTFKNFAKILK